MTDRSLPEALVAAFGRFGPPWVRFIKSQLPAEGVSPQRMRLIAALMHCPAPMIMARLTDALGTTPRAVTALVDGLEADGLVRRRAHPRDRRATVVELTAMGRTAYQELWQEHQSAVADIFAELSTADQRALLRSIERLTDALQVRGYGTGPPAEPGQPPGPPSGRPGRSADQRPIMRQGRSRSART